MGDTTPQPRMSGWSWILVAGLLEVAFATALKLQQTDGRWGIVFLACAIASFECLSRGIRTVSLSIGYAVWTGIGTVGTFLVGIVLFDEPAGLLRAALVAGLIAALVLLKVVSASDDKPADAV